MRILTDTGKFVVTVILTFAVCIAAFCCVGDLP